MTGTFTCSAGSNQFRGSITSTGLVTGKLFGPAAQEIGGVYTLRGAASAHKGVFASK